MSTRKFSLHTPEGKKLLLFCIFALGFSGVVLLISLDVDLAGLIPDQKRLDDLRREEKKALAAWKQVDARRAIQEKAETRYKKLLSSGWQESVNGSPDVEIPKMLNSIAKKHEIELNGVSAVRRNRINNDLTGLETDINTAAPLTELVSFLQDLRTLPVPFVWKRMDLRPETVQNSDRIFFSGTLRLLQQEKTGTNTIQGARP